MYTYTFILLLECLIKCYFDFCEEKKRSKYLLTKKVYRQGSNQYSGEGGKKGDSYFSSNPHIKFLKKRKRKNLKKVKKGGGG